MAETESNSNFTGWKTKTMNWKTLKDCIVWLHSGDHSFTLHAVIWHSVYIKNIYYTSFNHLTIFWKFNFLPWRFKHCFKAFPTLPGMDTKLFSWSVLIDIYSRSHMFIMLYQTQKMMPHLHATAQAERHAFTICISLPLQSFPGNNHNRIGHPLRKKDWTVGD